MKRLLVLAAAALAAAVVAKSRAGRDDEGVWREATAAPDLR